MNTAYSKNLPQIRMIYEQYYGNDNFSYVLQMLKATNIWIHLSSFPMYFE